MDRLVSIIIPVYNAANTLRKTVESIVYGKVKDIEIILVDDCSKDNSWEICKDLEKEFNSVRCIQNETNKGVSYTRNHGISEATGEYIMFVDSDDWVSKNYILELRKVIEDKKNIMVMSGFFYVDQLENKITYKWDNSKEEIKEITREQLLEAVDKNLLQVCWNKIFKRDIIVNLNIKFDEKQKIGEDFKFVLQYIEKGKIEHFFVLNRPLYYYIKANTNSLMSGFGWESIEFAIKNVELLVKIACKNNIEQQMEKRVSELKNNFIYHVMRTKKKSKTEKIRRIQEIMNNNEKESREYYKNQNQLIIKEEIVNNFIKIKNLGIRAKLKLYRIKQDKIVEKMRKKINGNKQVSIISQNCIGGVIYHDLGMKFLSPTINLFLKQPDFIRFVLNLEYYLGCELKMEWDEEYPIGYLDDIVIYFMHYNSCSEAKKSWVDRKKRIDKNKILILSTDRDGFDEKSFAQWKRIKYPKILFSSNIKYDTKDTIVYKKYKKYNCIQDLIPLREFYKDDKVINLINKIG